MHLTNNNLISKSLSLIQQTLADLDTLLKTIKTQEPQQQVSNIEGWIQQDYGDAKALSAFYCELLKFCETKPQFEHRNFVRQLLKLNNDGVINSFCKNVLIKNYPELVLDYAIANQLQALKKVLMIK